MSKINNKGFTLIELLVVVGIIAILAIAALIAINPLEAQRRGRDSARLQDLARLQGALEAYYNDNGSTAINATGRTTGTFASRNQPCGGTHWLGNSLNLCTYIKGVPADPQAGSRISTVSSTAPGARAEATANYGFVFTASTGDYEFCTYLEAEANRDALNDGGSSPAFFETGSRLTLPCSPF